MSTTPPPQEPQDPFGSSGVPSFPTGPAGSYSAPGRPPTPAQPSSIQLAVRLMWAGAAVALIGLIVSFATLGGLKDDIEDRLRKDDPSVSQSTIDAAYTLGIVFGIVFGLIGVGLWLWMAWKNGQGRPWARIVATVLGGLNVLFTLISFVSSADAKPISIVLSVVNLVLAAVILVLLWRKESNDFFTAASRPAY